MIKNVLTPDRLRAMQRVEEFILANPRCMAKQIAAQLAIPPSTLSGYLQALDKLGRLSVTRPKATEQGSLPIRYDMKPGLDPLPSTPLPMPREAPPPARRMDLVASLFGPALGITS